MLSSICLAQTWNVTAPVSRLIVNQSAIDCCHETADGIAAASAEKAAMDQKGVPRG
mgnify:CR=1 FL=1